MISCARVRFLLLALMVAASHVALVSHVAAHFQPSLEQCELCVSQAQPLAAIPPAEPALAPAYASAGNLPAPQSRVPPARVVGTPHQRAPPGASS